MKTMVYSTKPYDRTYLDMANQDNRHSLHYTEARLTPETVGIANGCDAVCAFVNDDLGSKVLQALKDGGTRLIALRCAGFNNVDLKAIPDLGMCVVRVPAYSPYAVAEHTIALLQTLNRKIHRAHNRVREGNFALNGLLGHDLHGKTVGVIGTGKIGSIVARIFQLGFGCKVLAHDIEEQQELLDMGVVYMPLDDILGKADVLTLHCPLTPETHYLINQASIEKMKKGVMLVNTSRGGLIDTDDVIDGIKQKQIGALALDVYEEESDLFFENLSDTVIQDDTFARLMTFPNVLITGHQAYFTHEALEAIATTTINNMTDYEENQSCENAVHCDRIREGESSCSHKAEDT